MKRGDSQIVFKSLPGPPIFSVQLSKSLQHTLAHVCACIIVIAHVHVCTYYYSDSFGMLVSCLLAFVFRVQVIREDSVCKFVVYFKYRLPSYY